jgi:DNA/RNA-binding domain of Phe-tRNA-synthetase-like protein
MMRDEVELDAAPGTIAANVAAEFPGLRLDWVTAALPGHNSPREIKRRVGDLSSRYRGATVVTMRTQPIPHAYRSFFRQIGLDPDVTRIPSERIAVNRLMQGQLRSTNLIEDALLIALVETGVPIWALDADLVDASGLGIRLTRAGDRLGSTELGHHLPPGRLAVTDPHHVHALLFDDEVAAGHGVGPNTSRVVLFAVGVEGVPAIHIEEALWVSVEVLRTA